MSATAVVWEGPETLRPLLAPVESLRTHPDNPRRGDTEILKTSLGSFGQLKPVIAKQLDGQDTIFAGNHTYRAARELGWTHVAVSRPVYLSDEEAEAYLLMDNRAADLATYDYGELTALLAEREGAGTLDRTGFTAADMDELRKEAAQLAGAAISEFEDARDEDGDGGRRPERTEPIRPPLRQMQLTFKPPEVFDAFARKIQALRKEFGTDDISSTVAEAVEREFRKVHGR